MRLFILGGDGFVGWPTSLHLSAQGHEVVIIDNLSRRHIDVELKVESLTPIASPAERCRAWREATGKTIHWETLDVASEYSRLVELLHAWKPDAVIDFAQQRAAPYSMKTPRLKRYTVNNNVSTTHNLLCALVDAEVDAHVVHLGTMGVYGYSDTGSAIPEGYLNVEVQGGDGQRRSVDILHPTNPGSIYHATKCIDQILFAFYAKNDGMRITDLHQGIVWGTQTRETALDPRLVNRFDYDGDYGTVLNRFLVQAALGYPLTVHGTGGQTRAFIHISDTVRCIELALRHAPRRGERVKIFNQATETHRVRELAHLVHRQTGCPIDYVHNPRNEAVENDLAVINEQFLALGLNPVRLHEGLMQEVLDTVVRFKERIRRERIPCVSAWTRAHDTQLSLPPAIDDALVKQPKLDALSCIGELAS
ncbi:NAD-dependent epimerase/dehydratase family protein [Variovorax sp. OV329]|uniref:NAD-dependent epimerase/dehydratase family protein n=1 Tax=Variovorax sp. OV329 TaxID=1882825 RepID=UPI0008DF85F6|nr:NAD-dependent epimerase/dehydratase family protein [Variovorax sp. OV329]SFM94517.1 UDP-sulfoquinovose synthase [Variovorax sp. OV329]